MCHKGYFVLILTCVFTASISGKSDLKSLSDFLDHIIDNKEQCIEMKEGKINSLKKMLIKKESSLGFIYEINDQLNNEYKKYKSDSEKTNSRLKRYLMLISVFSAFLIVLVLYVYKQLKKRSRIKEELSRANLKLKELIFELNETNNRVNERNEQLSESNQIKEQYIAQFFHQCSSYIDKMEEYRRTLYRMAINRHYEELIKKMKSTSDVESELEELYAHFDSIFLGLYPTFVSAFNSLLSKDEQITLRADGLLTRELRIYALLRLGITDGSQIASFLRCSLSTIYNYRSKMRNKATDRDQFEDLVMKIGISKVNN